MQFLSYTQIARAYDLSVPDIKTLLAEAGYLSGRRPTTRAAIDGVVQEKHLDQSKFREGAATMQLWEASFVDRILREMGVSPDREARIWSPESAAGRLSEAATLFWNALVAGRATLPREVERSLGEWRFEGRHLIALARTGDWAGAERWIEALRHPLEEHLKPRRRLELRDDVRLARHKLNSVLEWVAMRRARV